MKLLNTKPEAVRVFPKTIKIESIYRVIVIALLASILAAQIAILNRFSKPLNVNVQNQIEIQNIPFGNF
jgi:hypothetical protein